MVHQSLERFDSAGMTRQEGHSEGSAERVHRRSNTDSVGYPQDGLPDDLVRTLGPTNARRPTVGDHIVVGLAADHARLTRRAEDRQQLVWHRLNRHLAALLPEPKRALHEINVPPAESARGIAARP